MKFNEDSRVKIPAILHLVGLGYEYLSLKAQVWDEETNIFPEIFISSIRRLHPLLSEDDARRLLTSLKLDLKNEDLGRAFFRRLVGDTSPKLIDFETPDNNSYHVVTELTCKNGDEEFRPDITLLINGLPLVFIEVKKPNNREGILAERNRINTRFQNPKFRKFINITQLMMFSNNMEYDDSTPEPIEGAFYASPSYGKPHFNYFREEQPNELPALLEIPPAVEDFILKDNNLHSIKNSPEYATNKSASSATNRICSSLFSRERLAFLLRYSLAYVNTENNGIEKHVMRYPQIFATKAIQTKLDAGTRKGIIWHTQGSGKTALAFYNVAALTDYYQKQGVVPKFYFIVDRIDLLIQAALEFKSRGLIVHEINSRSAFAKDIASKSAIHNHQGKLEITVVNIQKFQDQSDVAQKNDYNIHLQRIYFLDEVHRSYNPEGSFLANLNESDPNAIKIGLTGTPLIGDSLKSKDLFGDYIHKYYYNDSIKDGYTLRLIREDIETAYHIRLAQELKDIEVLKGASNRKTVYAHETFVEPMIDYIVSDFERARLTCNDHSIGAMVICDSSEQAKMMHDIFLTKYANPVRSKDFHVQTRGSRAAEDEKPFTFQKKQPRSITSASLILHDIGTKESRKAEIEAFKDGKIDLLIVYNMLLTGFDAPRLKKLYLGRLIKAHNLLQALTRVNRTYKAFRYGYVVDFADISSEFDKTNKAYFDELQNELGDEIGHYSDLFKSPEEIESEIESIKDVLWKFDTTNLEHFSQQISAIDDRAEILTITKALNNAKSLYNLIRLSGQYEHLQKLDFKSLPQLATMASDHLHLINQKIALESDHDNTNILNIALEDILFSFSKRSEGELRIADELKNTLRKARESLARNFDPSDPEFITLKDELERLFKKGKLTSITQEDINANIKALDTIQAKARDLERRNQLLRAKYAEDAKYARIHKRLLEKHPLSDHERKLFEALNAIKQQADDKILHNTAFLNNTTYSQKEMLKLIIDQLRNKIDLGFDANALKDINQLILKEYLEEANGKLHA